LVTILGCAANLAFAGINGKGELVDYRGEKVISVYNKLNIKGLDWVIISEIDMGEAMKPVYEIRNYIVWMGIAISCFIVIITIILSKKISQPILNLHKVVLDLSKGILPKAKLRSNTNDEIGQITASLNKLVDAIKLTSNFANEIGQGNLNTHFKPLSQYDELGNALLQMRFNLKKLNEENLQLMKQRSNALLDGQEKERVRIARELHDGIGQMLTAIRLKLNSIEQEQNTKTVLKKMLDDTTNEIKRISRNLMPNVLMDFGLKAAIDELIENTLKYSSIPIEYFFSEKNNSEKLNFDIEVGIYRIAQEALNNCFQYADATRIEVKIAINEKNIDVFINDNGKGFDINRSNEKKFNGIKNMKERVHLLNGKFEILSETGKSTTILINIPIN
jgi:two-component system, NarL family, sensor kinase